MISQYVGFIEVYIFNSEVPYSSIIKTMVNSKCSFLEYFYYYNEHTATYAGKF